MAEDTLPRLTNVSNPAAFGVQWDGEGEGVEHQMVNPRGTTSLWFETRTPHTHPQWVHSNVVRPERFGLTTPPGSFKAFEAIVQAFLAGSESPGETP